MYVPQKGAAAFCRSIRAVYGAPSLAADESAWERSLDQVWQLFFCGSRHVHDQRPRVGQRELPQGGEEGQLLLRGRRDEGAVHEGLRALSEMGRGMPPDGVVRGQKPAAVQRRRQGEDRGLPLGDMGLTQAP